MRIWRVEVSINRTRKAGSFLTFRHVTVFYKDHFRSAEEALAAAAIATKKFPEQESFDVIVRSDEPAL